MAPDIKRVTKRIAELAQRPKNVRFEEIEWVVNQLAKFGYRVDSDLHKHGVTFTVNGLPFSVCRHHNGSSQVKAGYALQFLDRMIELGLYEG